MKSEQVIDHIKDSILKFVPARCIYLFGSYAYGTPTEKSDFDIYLVTRAIGGLLFFVGDWGKDKELAMSNNTKGFLQNDTSHV